MEDNLLDRDEILALDRVPIGMVRHTVGNESVALNNLYALITKFCTDFVGNRFGGYFVIPDDFWRRVRKEWAEQHGRDPKLLPRNLHGGYMGIFSYFTIYVGGVEDVVILKPDVGTLVFQATIGTEHFISISKEELVDTYGHAATGYDTRIPFVPGWEQYGYAYAPPSVLLEWANYDGYQPAVALLENPPQAALEQWHRQGAIAAP
jgi:hypothetical protein